MAAKTKVLIADDSSVSRDLLSFIIQSDASLEVVGTAENGKQAVELAESLDPDVIMMDIVMPLMNGFDATKKIMETNPKPIIIVSGVFNKDEISKAFDAIHAGAVTIIEKPKGVGDSQYLDTARFVIETIKGLSLVKVSPLTSQISDRQIELTQTNKNIKHPIDVIGIGASIGGPQALSQILSNLPGTFPVPIMIVQHISSGFIEGFGQWLNTTTQLEVKVAQNGEKALAGHVYLAPDKHQININSDGLISIERPNNDDVRPSINTLFESIASSFGVRGVGILLTGIGSDGVDGLKKIKEKGGITIVQDPQTTILPDLPRSAIDKGAATHVESLNKIPGTLKLLAQKAAVKS